MAEKSCDDLEEAKTSPVTVKNGCSEVGGYDCDFVETPADDLLCKICHFPACDPVLAVCCGHSFCNHCLERYLQSTIIDHSSCPYCRKEKFQSVPDKRTERFVLNLKVFCPNKNQGCNWLGELRTMEDHIAENSNSSTGCPFTKLQCSNGCGVVMQRRVVEGHLKSECELREVKCEYCNTTGSYQWINSSHEEECPKYPVECPNHCEMGHVRREEISEHLEECPLAIVECPYAAVGCESVVRRKEKMEHVLGSVGQHMEYILANQNEFQKRFDVKEQEMENVKRQLIAKERELDDVKRDLQATRDRLDTKEQAMANDLQSTIDRLNVKEKELQSTKRDLQATNNRIDTKEQEIEKIKRNLQSIRDRLNTKEQAMMSTKKDLQNTINRLDAKEKDLQATKQTMMSINKDLRDKLKQSEEIQSQLKTAIIEKGRKLDEVRKNAEENKKAIQQLKDKLEGTEQSLQHQLKVNTQLQLQVANIWPLQLNHLTNSGNEVVPVVIKLAEFERYKYNEDVYSSGFYTKGGYKMCLRIYPKGFLSSKDHVTVDVFLMKGDQDDHLTWPVNGNLTVQLLNQLSDSNHSEPVKLHFNGIDAKCQRVVTGTKSGSGVLKNKFMPHERLSYDADKKCQYLKDNCVFFRVCSFQ